MPFDQQAEFLILFFVKKKKRRFSATFYERVSHHSKTYVESWSKIIAYLLNYYVFISATSQQYLATIPYRQSNKYMSHKRKWSDMCQSVAITWMNENIAITLFFISDSDTCQICIHVTDTIFSFYLFFFFFTLDSIIDVYHPNGNWLPKAKRIQIIEIER